MRQEWPGPSGTAPVGGEVVTEVEHAALAVREGVSGLRGSVAGRVLMPADSDYDAARICFNALIDRRPALIVQCARARDVATAFDFAHAHEMEVAVRGGGHNPAG